MKIQESLGRVSGLSTDYIAEPTNIIRRPKMDLRELNEKLRKQLMNMEGVDREKVIAEIRARDRFLAELEEKLEVRCSCGLVMSRRNYYEHQKDTKHDLPSELGDSFSRRGKKPVDEPQTVGDELHVCSCGLVMSGANFQEPQKETRHTSHPRRLKRSNNPKSFSRAKVFEDTAPAGTTSVAGPDSPEEP